MILEIFKGIIVKNFFCLCVIFYSFVAFDAKADQAKDMASALLAVKKQFFGKNLEPGDRRFSEFVDAIKSPPKANNPIFYEKNKWEYSVQNFDLSGANKFFDPKKYFRWQVIELPLSSGASCGNGDPYRFFVNTSPFSRNIQTYLEPGGICNDYSGCTGYDAPAKSTKFLVASNVNGVPTNYLSTIPNGIAGLTSRVVNPLLMRVSPLAGASERIQLWNLIYIPYCTGDAHLGDRVVNYRSGNGSDTKMFHHVGLKNILGVAAWIRNNLQTPDQVFFGGASAGSIGGDINRSVFRQFLMPKIQYNFLDSGAFYPVDLSQNTAHSQLYSHALHNYWGLDLSNPSSSRPYKFIKQILPSLNVVNIGIVRTSYSNKWPKDRTVYILSHFDIVFPTWSFGMHPSIVPLAKTEGRYRVVPATFSSPYAKALLDIENPGKMALRSQIDSMKDTTGYFSTVGRRLLGSHVMSDINFEGSETKVNSNGNAVYLVNVLKNLRASGVPVVRLSESPLLEKMSEGEESDKVSRLLEAVYPSLFYSIK